MKKVIVVPLKLYEIRKVYTDQFFVLFNRLCKTFGFEVVFTDSLKGITAGLFLIQVGVHGQNAMRESTSLPPNKKVVLYLGGPHAFPRSKSMVALAFKRANYLLGGGGGEIFRKVWPEYVDKFEVFPNFFAPCRRYTNLRFNERPLMRCLLSGNTSGRWYPLRAMIAKAVLRGETQTQAIDIMRHPRWKTPIEKSTNVIKGVMGSAYAKTLNRYFCSFVGLGDPGAFPLAKYFEVPATGSLLLAEDSLEVRKVGFVADKNYISVNKDNVFAKINRCLANPEAYRTVRLEGMRFVRTNHSVENRIQRIGKILEML